MTKETKNISKHVRISEKENDNLKQICKKLDMTESNLIRLLLTDLNYRFCQDLRDKQAYKNYEEIESLAIKKERIRLLKNATTNFNQVSKALNESQYSFYSNDIKSVLNSLRLIINDFKSANEKEIKMPSFDKFESSETKKINDVTSQKKVVEKVKDVPKKTPGRVQEVSEQTSNKVEKEKTLDELLEEVRLENEQANKELRERKLKRKQQAIERQAKFEEDIKRLERESL